MANQINGYRQLLTPQYDTYDHWRAFALANGVNVDYSWGNQCWDICALLWRQYGLSLATGPNHYAYECWSYSRNYNAKFPFTAVGGNLSAMARKKLIKRGDCIVFAPSGGLYYTGHICFADEDYNGTDIIKCLGQNQGQGSGWGKSSNIANLNLSRFLGAFRNSNWPTTGPVITVKSVPDSKKFPFVLYARKFRQYGR